MYLILDNQGLIVAIAKNVRYTKKQRNGIVILCDKSEADAVLCVESDTFYELKGGYSSSSHFVAEVDSVPDDVVIGYYFYSDGEFFTTDEKQIEYLKKQLNDSDYKAIKYAEGELSEEEYESVRNQRSDWRERINELEATVTEM